MFETNHKFNPERSVYLMVIDRTTNNGIILVYFLGLCTYRRHSEIFCSTKAHVFSETISFCVDDKFLLKKCSKVIFRQNCAYFYFFSFSKK